MEMLTYTCQKCGHEWIPRKLNPTVCPNCMCRKWNRYAETDFSKRRSDAPTTIYEEKQKDLRRTVVLRRSRTPKK